MEILVNTLIQLLVFTLIPLVVYLVRKRRLKGFLRDLGFKSMTFDKSFMFVLILCLAIGLTTGLYVNSLEVVDDNLVTLQAGQYRFSLEGVYYILMMALIKTALSEEIFFRGFLFRRLIPLTGYHLANIIQASLFALIHAPVLIAFGLGAWPLLISPFILALLMAYINDKQDSILPSYLIHAISNVLSFGSQLF